MKQATSFRRGILSSVATIILFSVLIIGCKKEKGQAIPIINTENVAKRLMINNNFIHAIEDVTINLNKLYSIQRNKNSFVTDQEINPFLEEYYKSLILLLSCDDQLINLSNSQRIEVFTFILNAYGSPEFNRLHPEVVAPLKSLNIKLSNNIISLKDGMVRTNSLNSSQIKVSSITASEVLACALGTISSFLGSYGDAIDDIRYIFTQGWRGSALISAAMSILKNASPWWKVAGIVVEFGACMYAAS